MGGATRHLRSDPRLGRRARRVGSLLAVDRWHETQRVQIPAASYTLSVEVIDAVGSAFDETFPVDLLAVFAASVPGNSSSLW